LIGWFPVLLSVVIQNHSVPIASSSLLLGGLTPGALYRLQAATVSGELQSESTGLEARTGVCVSVWGCVCECVWVCVCVCGCVCECVGVCV